MKRTTNISEVLIGRFQLLEGKVRLDLSFCRPKGPSMRLKLSAKVRRVLVTLPVVGSTVIRCTSIMFGSACYYERRSKGY